MFSNAIPSARMRSCSTPKDHTFGERNKLAINTNNHEKPHSTKKHHGRVLRSTVHLEMHSHCFYLLNIKTILCHHLTLLSDSIISSEGAVPLLVHTAVWQLDTAHIDTHLCAACVVGDWESILKAAKVFISKMPSLRGALFFLMTMMFGYI